MTEASGQNRPLPRALLWLLVLAIPVVELIGHAVIVARVPAWRDFRAAAAYVREQVGAGDVIIASPAWSDPLVRRSLGDRITPAMAGRSDLAPFEHLWAVTIRGHRPPEAPDGAPTVEHEFGRVRVLGWDMGPSPVVYDLVEHVGDASVSMVRRGVEQPCPWRRLAKRGGGLGAGPAVPAERFVCDPVRPNLWVAATVLEDLDLQPRYCVWQHPQGAEPIRVRYDDVPLGDRIVLYAGLYSEDERMEEHGPVHVVVKVDGRPMGRMVHRDGEGWKRMEVSTQSLGSRGTVTIETTAANPSRRSLCWAANVRRGER